MPGIICASMPRHFSSSTKFFIIINYRFSIIHYQFPSRHRIIPAAPPGMATQDTPHGQIESLQRAVLQDGLTGIFGTRRRKPARGTQQRRNANLIKPDRNYQHPRQKAPYTIHHASSISHHTSSLSHQPSHISHLLRDSPHQSYNTFPHLLRRAMIIREPDKC